MLNHEQLLAKSGLIQLRISLGKEMKADKMVDQLTVNVTVMTRQDESDIFSFKMYMVFSTRLEPGTLTLVIGKEHTERSITDWPEVAFVLA